MEYFVTIVGIAAILGHKSFADLTVNYYSDLYRKKLGSNMLRFANRGILTIGILMTVVGTMGILNIVDFR